ncbi:MAG: DUF6231 family protein [Pseudomonadales bacterium]|nr:DUF6231 family protein [Pseudomonadales bacterium]
MSKEILNSPLQFLSQWITENGLLKLGYVGERPQLPESAHEGVALIDFNGVQPWQNLNPQTELQAILIAGVIESLSKEKVTQLLAGYRNTLVETILVLVNLSAATEWSKADFYGLGFKHRASFPNDKTPLELFEYNLRSYNHKRLWNSPKYWANPENFGKCWW